MSNLASIPTQIRDQFQQLLPPFLNNGNGERFAYSMSLMNDFLLEKWFQAACIRVPGAGDVSQIPYLCNDRNLVQGPAETDASVVTRLQQAFQTAKLAGSRIAVLRELQAYMQNLQPGVSGALPEMTIVGGNSSVTSWSTLYQGTTIGAPPTITTVPANWNWDGAYKPWRSWLILYMYAVATGQSGTGATVSSTTTPPGSLAGGQNVNGVWVPATSGTPVNYPWITLTGLSGLSTANLYDWLTLSGSSNAGNNGAFQIVTINSATSCVVANPGYTADFTSYAWSIAAYPYIAPGPAWGAPGIVFGQGQNANPPPDFGSNVGGVWRATTESATLGGTLSWGLSCSEATIVSIRQLLQRWKSATTFYPHIIVAFDGGTGAAGSAFSPNSSEGAGNPDGTFGGYGNNVGGVWVPNRIVTSAADCYAQGTGSWAQCTVENVT